MMDIVVDVDRGADQVQDDKDDAVTHSVDEENNIKKRGKNELNINKTDINRLLQQLYVAHELAVHEDIQDRDNNRYRHNNERMRSVLRKAYWNQLKEQLNDNPIRLELIYELLTDIKKCLDLVMIPATLKDEICNGLDIEMLKYLTDQYGDVINILKCSGRYVVRAISEQCGPLSNRLLLKLSRENDILALYRGIVNIIGDLMKPHYITSQYTLNNHLDYEREKFKEYIILQGGILPITNQWLSKHSKAATGTETWKQVILNSFIELLNWDQNEPYPETVFLEEERLNKLKQKYFRITVSCTLYFLSIGLIKTTVQTDSTIKQSVKSYITDTMNTANTNEQLQDIIKNIAEQLISNLATDIQKIKETNRKRRDIVTLKIFEETLIQAALPSSKIRTLISNKVNNYLKQSLWPPKAKYESRFPYALSKFKKEMHSLKLLFVRIFAHNLLVCMPHYQRILNVNYNNNKTT